MSSTAFKAVTSELKSPFVGPNAGGSPGPFGSRQITYSVGDDFDAEGSGLQGIFALPTLDAVVARTAGFFRPGSLRYLELSYEDADVLGTRGDELSLAAAHVTAEVTP